MQDRFKNIVATDDSIVTLSVASGPSGVTLGGTDSLAASNGTATFDDLEFSIAGQYRLKATVSGLSLIGKPVRVTGEKRFRITRRGKAARDDAIVQCGLAAAPPRIRRAFKYRIRRMRGGAAACGGDSGMQCDRRFAPSWKFEHDVVPQI